MIENIIHIFYVRWLIMDFLWQWWKTTKNNVVENQKDLKENQDNNGKIELKENLNMVVVNNAERTVIGKK